MMAVPGPRTCVVLQPGYLPWLGFFEQLHRADEFVFLDDVQFDKHGWRNRNRIKGPEGPQWLTVPVRVGGQDRPRISEVEIDSTQRRWPAKHLQSLRSNYAPCPFFGWLYPELEEVLQQPWERIVDLDIALVERLCDLLGLRRSMRRCSSLDIAGERCERLVKICHQLDCERYYSGAAARDYLDVALFERGRIAVEFQDFIHPEYPQRYGAFCPHLSVVDLMFNCGPRSLEIICGAGSVASSRSETLPPNP